MPRLRFAEPDEQRTRWSLFGGLTVWFLHLTLLNTLIAVGCEWGWPAFSLGPLSGLQLVGGLLSLVAALALLVAIIVPWSYWRSFLSQRPAANPRLMGDTEADRRPLLAFIALLMNSFFLLFVVATFVPLSALTACGHA